MNDGAQRSSDKTTGEERTGDVPGRLDAIKAAVPVSILDMLWADALKRPHMMPGAL